MMPPNTKEALHYHHKAQQFFFVLSGEETFETEEKTIEVKVNEGFYFEPNRVHKIKNVGPANLHFLVISKPKAHDDQTNI